MVPKGALDHTPSTGSSLCPERPSLSPHYATSNTASYRPALSPTRMSAFLEQSFIYFFHVKHGDWHKADTQQVCGTNE